MAVLRAVFPGMQVSIDPAKRIDDSWPQKPNHGELFFPDFFANENVYRVIGKATNEAERESSEDIIKETFSITRQVRMSLFRWPKRDPDLLAVMQYDFAGASPAMSCPSVGLLVHLYSEGGNWKVSDKFVLETVHHHAIQNVALLDLTGDAVEDLLVESDSGGAGESDSSLQVFDLSRGHVDGLLNTFSRLDSRGVDDGIVFSQALDVNRTLQNHGQRFCVSKSLFFAQGKWVKPPQVTHPCYARGAGVDPKNATSNNMLAPLR